MTLQVTDWTKFDANSQKKNIGGRLTLSDGVSTMVAMIPLKVFA